MVSFQRFVASLEFIFVCFVFELCIFGVKLNYVQGPLVPHLCYGLMSAFCINKCNLKTIQLLFMKFINVR